MDKFSEANFALGAGDCIRGVLQNLFNDSSEEARLLAFQLSVLQNHLVG